tara:strand:- start:139 stop:372 length:234 start_codon:yes stop_codon:yes gene_type:complete
MAVADIVTMGFGSFSSAKKIPTMGFSSTDAPTVPSPYIPGRTLSDNNYRLAEEGVDSLRQPGIGEADSYRLNPDQRK